MKRLVLAFSLAVALLAPAFVPDHPTAEAASSETSDFFTPEIDSTTAAPIGQLLYVYFYGWMYVYYWNGTTWILLTSYPWP